MIEWVWLENFELCLWVNRLSKLVDEEIEADEEFWGQEAFKEVRILSFRFVIFNWFSKLPLYDF